MFLNMSEYVYIYTVTQTHLYIQTHVYIYIHTHIFLAKWSHTMNNDVHNISCIFLYHSADGATLLS